MRWGKKGGSYCDTKPVQFLCRAHDKSLGSRDTVIATGAGVQRGLQVLILFIYLPLWIIVSVNQRRLDKGFHAAENSYTATLEGDRQRRLYSSPALISTRWCKLIHSLGITVTRGARCEEFWSQIRHPAFDAYDVLTK